MVKFELNYQNLYFYRLFCLASNLHYQLFHCFQIFSLRLMISSNFFLVSFGVIFPEKNHLDLFGLFKKLILFTILDLDNFDFHYFKNFRNLRN